MISSDDNRWLQWLVWVFVIFIGNVVFMNFIIAVVSDSYEKCISKMEAQLMLEKIDMIIEREEMLTQAEITRYSAEWFPKYLYVCRVAPSEDKTSSAGDPWQGIVKEVKKQLAKASTQRLQERLHRQT